MATNRKRKHREKADTHIAELFAEGGEAQGEDYDQGQSEDERRQGAQRRRLALDLLSGSSDMQTGIDDVSEKRQDESNQQDGDQQEHVPKKQLRNLDEFLSSPQNVPHDNSQDEPIPMSVAMASTAQPLHYFAQPPLPPPQHLYPGTAWQLINPAYVLWLEAHIPPSTLYPGTHMQMINPEYVAWLAARIHFAPTAPVREEKHHGAIGDDEVTGDDEAGHQAKRASAK